MSTKWLLAMALCFPGAAQPAQDEGKALLERTCGECHALSIATSEHNTRERWASVVDDMVSRGAEATDTEIEKIVDYLAKNYGPKINVNKASADELVKGLELSKSVAASIVEYREKNGSFTSIDDLKKAAAAGAQEIEARKARIAF